MSLVHSFAGKTAKTDNLFFNVYIYIQVPEDFITLHLRLSGLGIHDPL